MSTQVHLTMTLATNVTPVEAARIIAQTVEDHFSWVVGVDLDAVTEDTDERE